MDTKQEIMNYIEANENNGALLITGKWGCGKTFLIKQIAEELNQGKKYCVAVISMFDVNSIEQLHEKIREEFFQLSLSKAGKAARATTKVLEFTNKIIDSANKHHANSKVDAAAGAIGTVLSINPSDFISVSNMIGKKQFILILDDIERCDMNKTQLLGGVNEYCENKAIKTIIVADEEKIEDDKYKEFKEKVIARTIKFHYNHEDIIEKMIINYHERVQGYNQFLNNNKQIILSAFNDSNCNNLRTVKAVICDFERVYGTWIEYGKGLDDMWFVLYQFFALTAECKIGNYYKNTHYNMYMLNGKSNKADATYKETKNDREKIEKKYKKGTFLNIFDSISRWVVDGEWNSEDFINELKQRFEEKELMPKEKFLAYNILSLDNESIIQGITYAKQKAYNGDLCCDELISFLQKVHFIRKINESLVDDIDYEQIEEGLDSRFKKIRLGQLSEPRRRKFADNDEIDEGAINIYKKVDNLIHKSVGWNGYKTFLSVLKEKDFGFDNLYRCNCIDVFDEKLFNAFIDCFNSIDNGYKMDIKDILLKINWNNKLYSSSEQIDESISNFRKLIDHLKNKIQSENDMITKYIYKKFKEELEKMIIENTSAA